MKKGERIGILLNTFYSDYSVVFMNGIDRFCADKDCSYFVFPLEHGKNSGVYDSHCETLTKFIREENIDGLIIAGSTLAYGRTISHVIETARMLPPHLPKIFVGFPVEGIHSIDITADRALKNLAGHLVKEHGVKAPVIMRCAKGNFESDIRERILLEEFSSLGVNVPEERIINGNFLFDNAISSLSNYIRKFGADFDAVVCLNDSMAMGAQKCLDEKELYVPEKIIVTGFDNVFETSTAELSITTIDQHIAELAYSSMEKLFSVMEGRSVPMITSIDAELVVRGSCGCPANYEKNGPGSKESYSQHRYEIFRRSTNQLYMLHYFLMETQTPVPLENLYSRLHYSLCLFDIHGFVIVLYKHSVYHEAGENFKFPDSAKVAMTFFNEGSFERPDTEFNPNDGILPDSVMDKMKGGYSVFPIYAENYQYGYLMFDFGRYERIFYQSIFELIAKEIVTSIKLSYEQTEKNSLKDQNTTLEQYSQKMHELSFTDEMTGLLNRRGFYEYARQQITTSLSQGRGGLIIYCDMDGLKKINDTFGHDVGDRAIKYEAQVLRAIFRSNDIVGRLGGDEFAVLAADMKPKDFGRIKKALAAECDKINSGCLEPFVLSVSIGFTEFTSAKDDIEELLNSADSAQYEDKRAKKEKQKQKEKKSAWWRR